MLAINRVNPHGLHFYITQVATDSKQSLVRCAKNGMREMTMNHPIHEINTSWHRWTVQGYFIQDAFPYMTPEEREFLLTGTTPEEWNELFPPNHELGVNEVKYDDGHVQMALPFTESPYDELKSDRNKGNE